jgi:hypothetical protein
MGTLLSMAVVWVLESGFLALVQHRHHQHKATCWDQMM